MQPSLLKAVTLPGWLFSSIQTAPLSLFQVTTMFSSSATTWMGLSTFIRLPSSLFVTFVLFSSVSSNDNISIDHSLVFFAQSHHKSYFLTSKLSLSLRLSLSHAFSKTLLALVLSRVSLQYSPFSRKTHKSCKRWFIPKLSVVEQLAQLIVAAATAAAAEESSKLVELFFTFFWQQRQRQRQRQQLIPLSFFFFSIVEDRLESFPSTTDRSKLNLLNFCSSREKFLNRGGGGGPVLEGN